jgi:hypothetical protein
LNFQRSLARRERRFVQHVANRLHELAAVVLDEFGGPGGATVMIWAGWRGRISARGSQLARACLERLAAEIEENGAAGVTALIDGEHRRGEFGHGTPFEMRAPIDLERRHGHERAAAAARCWR